MEELNMVNYIGVCTLEEDVFHVWKNVFYGSLCPNMSILEALTHTHTHTHRMYCSTYMYYKGYCTLYTHLLVNTFFILFINGNISACI